MATGIGTAACRARRRMKAVNFEAEIDHEQQPEERRRRYGPSFERAPRPAAGAASALSRRVRLGDIPCGPEPKRTLLCDERRGRETSKQQELAAAAESASCPKLTPC